MDDAVRRILAELEDDGDGQLAGEVHHGGQVVEFIVAGDPEERAPGAARVLRRLGDLDALTVAARRALARDLDADEDSPVGEYRQLHADELAEDELDALFGGDDAWSRDIRAFLERCELVGVLVELDGDESSLSVDLALGGDMTEHVLCVTFDVEGHVQAVEMES